MAVDVDEVEKKGRRKTNREKKEEARERRGQNYSIFIERERENATKRC
jgi:hypothetical protein